MSAKIKYSDEPLGEPKVVRDFLPSPDELAVFKDDLLESARQMRRGQIARITRVEVPDAAKDSAPKRLLRQVLTTQASASARTRKGKR